MNIKNHSFTKRYIVMLLGIFLIGICVGCFRLSLFGVDAFTCMNLGISGFIDMSFGTWQLIVNALILIIVFFTVRHCIGIGTIVNMVGVGYMADFICWFVKDMWGLEMILTYRMIALFLGMLFASIGVALYMTAELGIAPYDSVALILEKVTGGKLEFQKARVFSDVTCVIIGVIFCLIAGNPLREIIGIGTVCNALFNGPLIQFFKTHFVEPVLFHEK